MMMMMIMMTYKLQVFYNVFFLVCSVSDTSTTDLRKRISVASIRCVFSLLGSIFRSW